MPETTATYDAGEVRVRVDGEEQRTSPKVAMLLETAFAAEMGVGAWGELHATFERGELKLVRTSKTTKPIKP